MQETLNDLLADLGLPEGDYLALHQMVKGDHKYIRDLRINFKNTLESQHHSKKQGYLIALAVASNERSSNLIKAFTAAAAREGASEAELAEAHAVASLLATLNVYYRFKHFAENKAYDSLPAGIKMTIMARPVLGKVFFELLSLVVSAVNGCETCVNNHEQSVRHEGGTQEQIFDAIRLGAVVKGMCVAMHESTSAPAQ
jgi:lipoyl-dependent peroxiredoxin subunit D